MSFFALRFDVVSGPHAGANTLINEKTVSVGRGEKDDIYLFASSLQSNHFSISRSSFLQNWVSISTNNADIIVNQETVSVNSKVSFELPCTVEYNETAIQLSRPIDPFDLLKKIIISAILIAISIVIWGMISNTTVFRSSANQNGLQGFASKNQKINPNNYQSQSNTHGLSSPQIDTLEKLLAENNLLNLIELQQETDEFIVAKGHISPDDMLIWEDIERQFYALFPQNTKPLLISLIKKSENGQSSNMISSVWLDELTPRIYTNKNMWKMVGDDIGNGWIIDCIKGDYYVVSKNDVQYAISYLKSHNSSQEKFCDGSRAWSKDLKMKRIVTFKSGS